MTSVLQEERILDNIKACLNLTDEQDAKLTQLAKARKRTRIQCLQDFISTCQPNGSGWRHPSEGHKLQ